MGNFVGGYAVLCEGGNVYGGEWDVLKLRVGVLEHLGAVWENTGEGFF